MGKDGDTGGFNTDNERRGGSIARTRSKSGIIGRTDQANNECSKDIEQNNTDIDFFDSFGKVLAGITGFTSGDSDDFSTNVRLKKESQFMI
jgi:hypothetical protein